MSLLLAVLSALCEYSSPIDRAEQLGSGTRENRARNTGIEELSRQGDGAYAGHWKGSRPVVYKINLLFRRFGCGTGQITGLIVYYIAQRPQDARRGSSVLRAPI